MIKCLKDKDLSKIPNLFQTDDLGIEKKEKVVYLHFFNDKSHWFIVETNGKDIFYGFVVPDVDLEESEWRDIPFMELQFADHNSAQIKSDPNWKPTKAGSVELIRVAENWEY